MDAITAIMSRRSMGTLVEPAPSEAELETLLTAAVTAPDHHELRPWRFFVIKGKARAEFGRIMAEALIERDPQATPGMLQKEEGKLQRAPLVIAVAAKNLPDSDLPFTELVAATDAATQNILIAATALGYGSIWRTGPAVKDDMVKGALGLDSEDELTGFIYLGTVPRHKTPNSRSLDIDSVAQVWSALPLK